MNLSRFLVSAAAVLAVTACSSVKPSLPSDPLVDADRLMPNSVLRVGKEVSLSTQQGALTTNFSVACDSTSAWLLFSTGPRKRLYPSTQSDAYGDRRELGEDAARKLKAIPLVKQACETRPDWREVRRNDGVITMIDIHGVQNDDGLVRLWGLFDYPEVTLDPPYRAPYGQKYERFDLFCKEQTYALLGGYDIDTQNRVTDGQLFPRPARERIDGETNADYKALFAAACGDPTKLKALPAFVAREKAPLPGAAPLAAVPEVLKSIAQLDLPVPQRQLKRLVLEGTHTLEGKTTPSRQETAILSRDKAGLMSRTETSMGYEATDLSFLGIVAVKGDTSFTGFNRKSQTVATEVGFEGNWRQMPVGTEISYTLASRYVSDFLGTRTTKRTTQCKVVAELDAPSRVEGSCKTASMPRPSGQVQPGRDVVLSARLRLHRSDRIDPDPVLVLHEEDREG